MAEEFLGLGIIVFTALIMIVIGISQIKSKNPVAFYTGEKPPQKEDLSDVSLWNKKHGMMWILYGVTMIGSYILSMVFPDEFIVFVIILIAILGGIVVMVFYHHYLMIKYLK